MPSSPTVLSIRNLAIVLFSGIFLILMAFTLNAVWLTAQIQNVGHAINLAGTQRYSLYQTANLLRNALDSPPLEQARLMVEVQRNINHQQGAHAALRMGSAAYGVEDVSGPAVDQVLDQAARHWQTQIAPLFNSIPKAPQAEHQALLVELETRIDNYVDQDLNVIVAAFVTQQELALHTFAIMRYSLAVFGIFLLVTVFFYTRRHLLAPIATLIDDSRRIAEGNYGLRTTVHTHNELGTLAEHFNRMTVALDRTIHRLAATVKERTRDLENSQKQLRALIDNAPDAIIAIRTVDNTIILFSHGAEKMFGYHADEVMGRHVNILLPNAGQPKGDDGDYQALTQPRASNEIRSTVAQRKNGSRLQVEVSVSETVTGAERTLTAIIRDVTARIEAERAIAEKTHELEITSRIDRIGAQVMVSLNQQEGDTSWTQEVLEIIATDAGYRPMAFYQHDEWEGGLRLSASLGMARTTDRQKLLEIGEGLVGEAAERRKPIFINGSSSGEAFSLESGVGTLQAQALFALPIIHREILLGVISGASQHLLTEREKSWLVQLAGQMSIGLHALRQYKDLQALSKEVVDRSQRIEMQNQELAKASRLKSEFLSSVSHELRTPLNAIIGFSEMLRDGLAGPLSERQVDYVSEVYQSGRHLLSLINDILDLSKIEAGKMELALEQVNLNELIDNAITIMRGRALSGGVSLSKTVAPNIGNITADGRKLRQIIYNLLSNAVKFTPEGGSVRIEAAVRGPDIEIAVTDTGIGITPEDQARLFRAFEQLDSGADRRFEGTGLGLVMVKSLAELHGGTVGVESARGCGSRFWVRLPYQQDEKTTPRPLPLPSLSLLTTSQPPCVLVVDDDPAALSLARRWLTGAGYAVEMAPDCDTAWRKLQRQEFSAILLDIMFAQGPGGWEWLERIKQEARYASIPVIVISIAAELEKGLALGAEAVLQKPVSGQDMLGALESLGLLRAYAKETPHILVVDDDPGSVDRIARQIERTGMLVSRAYSGVDALTAIRHQQFAAVVLDLMMPDVSGIDVVRELRSDPTTAELPVLMMTSGTIEPAERAQMEQSVSSVLNKGQWDEARFLRVIRSEIFSQKRKQGGVYPSADAATPPNQAHASPTPTGTIATILVVDDDPNVGKQLRLYLETAEYHVILAASSEEAIACLQTTRPDLITLDLHLPGMSGLSLLTSPPVKRLLSGIPVLVVSGAEHPEHALAVGAHAVLCKPVLRHELLESVMRLLSELRPGQAPRVLVVDDDPRAVTVVTTLLSEQDIDVLGIHDGQEALDAIDRYGPDLVILDLIMPGVSGFEVLARLRIQDVTRHIPVIILTAKSLTEREKESLASAAQSILQKCTASQTVLSEVQRLLGAGKQPMRNRKTPE